MIKNILHENEQKAQELLDGLHTIKALQKEDVKINLALQDLVYKQNTELELIQGRQMVLLNAVLVGRHNALAGLINFSFILSALDGDLAEREFETLEGYFARYLDVIETLDIIIKGQVL